MDKKVIIVVSVIIVFGLIIVAIALSLKSDKTQLLQSSTIQPKDAGLKGSDALNLALLAFGVPPVA
jgi:hypothetical protein